MFNLVTTILSVLFVKIKSVKIRICFSNKNIYLVYRRFVRTRRQLARPAPPTPRTLLLPSVRSTFRSAICSQHAQLFLKSLCIYMSVPYSPSARACSVRRIESTAQGYIRPEVSEEERERTNGREERRKERTRCTDMRRV